MLRCSTSKQEILGLIFLRTELRNATVRNKGSVKLNSEMISINYDSEQPTVLGRDLHAALEVKTEYKDWFPRMCERGGEE